VLGPLLFTIYVDDLWQALPNGVHIKQFADDTTLFHRFFSNQSSTATRVMQAAPDGITEWSAQWQMPLNVRKCSVMYVGHDNPHAQYVICGVVLEQAEQTRDLGVTISSSIKFSEHCCSVAAKARKISGLLLRAFKSRSRNVILPLYKSVIRPLVEYASPVWNPLLRKDVAEIESVQRHITKKIKEVRGLSYEERLRALGLPTLEQRRLLFDILQCYKIVRRIDTCVGVLCLRHRPANTRGHELMLSLPMARILVCRHSFSQRVVRIWNALPEKIVLLPLAAFKRAVRQYVFT
jgi:ribonucleases P/MRP protein subunit RPP40